MHKLIISAEVKNTPDAVFIAMGRRGHSPTPPGYTVSLDGEVIAIRQDPDAAIDFAVDYKFDCLGGNAEVIVA
jgi:hypothetical protein